MENRILLDTSVLIDYFRKTEKSNSFLLQLTRDYETLVLPTMVQFEILSGSNKKQDAFWEEVLEAVEIIPFGEEEATIASETFKQLKRKNALIGTKDLLIAATALNLEIPLATLNTKHFSRVPKLKLISPQ